MSKEELLSSINGKTDDQIKQILQDNFNISWECNSGSCKQWYSKVFTYCKPHHLQEELDFFLWLVNFFAPIFHFCFQEESTVFLGCVSPCGEKQTILYYSITPDL